jgi:hypothetical protein
MSEWKSITVMIETGDPEVDAIGVFDDFTHDDWWNGFVTPCFTEEQGKRVVVWTEALVRAYGPDGVETVTWDPGRRGFVTNDPSYPHARGEPVDGRRDR